MFRKSLTALALMGVASHGAASVLTNVVGEVVLTPQATTTLKAVAAPDFALEIEAASIAAGSVANVTFSKAPTNANLVTVTHSGGVVLSYSGATNDGKTLNYTTADVIVDGDVITFQGTEFAIADVSSTPISVDASFSNVGSGIDPATAKLELITETATDQYGLSVTLDANAVVDVEAARYAFDPVAGDEITFATTDTDGDTEAVALGEQRGTVVGAVLTGVTYTLSGDFAWAEDIAEDPVVAGFQLAAGAVDCAGGGAVTELAGDDAPTATSYKFSTTSGASVTCTLTPQAVASEIVLPTAEFEVSSTVAYDDLADDAVAGADAAAEAAAGTQAVAAEDAGEWTINGAETTVFAVPFGAEVESHSIFVSNSGTTTGAITGSMRWNGNDAVVFSLGNIEAGANKYLNIIEALTAAGELPPFGRADITFTVNAPKAAIAITAGYNTANGRTNLFVEDQTSIDTIF